MSNLYVEMCKKCGITKKKDAFSKGYKTCKSCRSEIERHRYTLNKEHILTSKKEYYIENQEKICLQKKEYRNNNKSKLRKIDNDRYYRDKDKRIAVSKLKYAVDSGMFERPNKCSKCQIECKPHGHHTDYSKPLDVVWLCEECHLKEHGRMVVLPR